MKVAVAALTLMLATTAGAQTVNDDTPAAENWWDNVGAGFFSDATLLTPRPEYEIRAHWTGLSEDDRAAVLARCAELQGQSASAPSLQEGSTDEAPGTTAADLADGATTGGLTGAADDQTAAVENDGTPVPEGQNDSTTVTGSIAGQEVQSADSSDAPAPNTGLAGAAVDSEDMRAFRVCDLVKTL